MITRYIQIICFSVLLFSCNSTSSQKYVEWIESEEGYSRKIEIENFNIGLQYCPVNYLKLKGKADIASDSIYYFIMKVEPKDHLVANGFSFNQSYFAFDFPKDISIKENDLACEIEFWHMENTYNLTKSRNFLLSVKKNSYNFDKNIYFSIDSEVIQDNMINFTFNLSREPKVQI